MERTGDVTVRDAGIDLNDTHLALEVIADVGLTISSDTPFQDPLTGAMTYEFVFPVRAESLHLEAGFDVAGRAHLNTYDLGAPDPALTASEQVRATQSIDAAHVAIDGSGAPFVPPIDAPPPGATLGLLGDVSDLPIDAYVAGGGAGGGGGGGPGGGDTILMMMRMPAPANDGRFASVRSFEDARGQLHVVRELKRSSADLPAVQVEQLFRLGGGGWRLAQVSTTSDQVVGSRHHVARSVTRLRTVRMKYNAAKARERARRRASRTPQSTLVGSTHSLVMNPCIKRMVGGRPEAVSNLRTDCGTSGGGPAGFPSTPIPASVCSGGAPVERTGTGLRNVLLVHGLGSSGCAWQPIAPSLPVSGRLRAVNLPSFNSYSFQADSVRRLLLGWGNPPGGAPVLIGHSQGGMISRLAAQRSPTLVRGVITIGTPNMGAPFARDWQLFGFTAAATAYVLIPKVGPAVTAALGIGTTLTSLAQCQIGPALCDANPSNGTVAGINSSSNAPLPGAAVVHHAGDDRLLYRTVGDFASDGGGRSAHSTITSVYRGSMACAVAGGIVGFLWPPAWAAAAYCGTVVVSIDALDWSWQRSVSGGATSDGFIPVASQEWPGVSNPNRVKREDQQFRVPNGATHAAELRDVRTRDKLIVALGQYFP